MTVRELIEILSHYPSRMEIVAACDNMVFELTDEIDTLEDGRNGTLCLIMNDMEEEILYDEDDEEIETVDNGTDISSYFDPDML